jgi:hypothetical protein
MTEYLVAARAAIILWTNLAVMPAEILFDAIEAELEPWRRAGHLALVFAREEYSWSTR